MGYTKGQWERHSSPKGEHLWCGDKHIADFDGKNANADAKLCVAAPDMYEALKNMLSLFDRGLPDTSIGKITCLEARQALAKAEGK